MRGHDVRVGGPGHAAPDALGIENSDERGWRFAPHGWVVTLASLNPASDTDEINRLFFSVA